MSDKEKEIKKNPETKVETPKEELINTKVSSTTEDVPVKVPNPEAKIETANETPSTVPSGDTAVELSKADYSSALDQNPTEIDGSSKQSKEIIKTDKEVKDAIAEGSTGGMTSAQISVANKPLVADLVTSNPVYETNEQWMLAQAAAGKLSTEAPKED